MTDKTRIRVGTASWTDHEPFYPSEYSRADMKSWRIEYYARFFSVVEVDSTYYSLQPARNFALWAERTPDDFIFDVKAYSELTWHHRDDQGQGQPPSSDTFARYSEMLKPMREARKLGAVLFQFPPWFTFSDERLEYLGIVRESLPDDTVAVEFRHRSWVEDEAAERTKDALTAAHLAYCAVDEPQVGSGSVPPIVMLTDPTFSMVRFHGRNRATWYGKGLTSSRQRYDYLYSVEELQPWAERIQRIAERLAGSEVHVIANNNASNYGIVNALDLQDLLGQPVGLGSPLPEGVLATMRTRAGHDESGKAPGGQGSLWSEEA
jgi:uncharacterized protein YecE (DUF72 family)